jgi:hypothetical protein
MNKYIQEEHFQIFFFISLMDFILFLLYFLKWLNKEIALINNYFVFFIIVDSNEILHFDFFLNIQTFTFLKHSHVMYRLLFTLLMLDLKLN